MNYGTKHYFVKTFVKHRRNFVEVCPDRPVRPPLRYGFGSGVHSPKFSKVEQ